MPTKCFMLTETRRCRRWLRRYFESACPLMPGQYSYHNVQVLGEDADLIINPRDDSPHAYTISCEEFKYSDPRWPKVCPCGFVLPENAYRQTFFVQIYLTPDGKEVSTHCSSNRMEGIQLAPPGAMWYADWSGWKGPDGRTLVVMTPGGEWCIDGPSKDGNFPWKREGVPPLITANPSINIEGKYHGWLRNGELSDPI